MAETKEKLKRRNTTGAGGVVWSLLIWLLKFLEQAIV